MRSPRLCHSVWHQGGHWGEGRGATTDHVPPPRCDRNGLDVPLDARPGSTLATLSVPWACRRKVQRRCPRPRAHSRPQLLSVARRPLGHARSLARGNVQGKQIPFFRPKIHMVSRESMSVRPRPNHSLKDWDTGLSSSWPQANLRYPSQACRKASTTAFWRLFGGAGEGAGCSQG